MLGVPEPNYEDPKEVFAFYGLAMYYAQVLEQELGIFAAMLVASGQTRLTREYMDSLFKRLDSQTFGQLLAEARRLTHVPPELDAHLAQAVRRRNVLAHAFFAEHSEDLLSDGGRRAMIDVLRDDISFYQQADAAAVAIREPLSERLGFTKAMAENALAEARTRAAARDGA